MKCKYCKQELMLTDEISGVQWWECVRDDQVFRVDTHKIKRTDKQIKELINKWHEIQAIRRKKFNS